MENLKDYGYYIQDDSHLTSEQRRFLKENNIYLVTIISHLLKNQGKTNTLSNNYRTRIFSGNLYRSDKKLQLDTNELGKKLKALIVGLELNKKNEVNEFINSKFFAIMKIIASGFTFKDEDDQWMNYIRKNACDDKFSNKPALAGALDCYKSDNTSVGLNMAKIFDDFFKKDINGEYRLYNPGTEKELAITEAVIKQVEAMKSNPEFQKNYSLNKENGLEDTENE